MRLKGLFSTLSLLGILLISLNAKADWDMWQTYAIIDFGDGNHYRAGGLNADVAVEYENYYYGFFRSTDTFILNGGEMKTYKNGSSNVCGGSIYYRVYKECETPGAFSSIAFGFLDAFPSAGLPNPGDQKWGESAANIDLLSGLSKGDYVLEVYWEAEGNQTNSGGCGEFKYDSNGGANYLAYFSVGEEAFTDGDHSADPVWTGDTGDFTVLDPTSLAGDGSNANINGAAHQNNDVLVSNSGSTDAALVTASTQAYGVWEFSVATGLNWDTSNSNNFVIVLTSDTNDPANLIIDSGSSAPDFNGYGIKFGQDGATDSFRLVKQTGTVTEEILDTGYPALANAYDGYTVRVVRSTDGDFSVYIDQGFDNTDATTLRGTFRDNSHTTSAYSAVVLNANSGGAARRLYFDNLMRSAATELSFDVATVDVQETDSDFAHNLTVNIANEDDLCETTADVVLISGDAARIGSYTTQSITFPAGSNTAIDVPVTISGNTLCERNETLVFQLQNVALGCNAIPAGNITTRIELDDDESGTEDDLDDDFEDNDISNWLNTTQWQTINSSATISGSYDVRHTQTVAANDYMSFNMCNLETKGVETTWRWNMKHGGFETSSNNWLMFNFLSNQSQVWNSGAHNSGISGTLDGYAVGVNYGTATDNLRLVRIDNGVVTDLITSTYDWNSNVILGIEVVRDENGLFELKYQEGNGFDALISAGTFTDATYSKLEYMSFSTNVTVGNVNKCRLDDVSVTQYGCFETWYTTGTGNATAAIWSQNDLDVVGSTLNFGRFKNLVNQDGHTLTIDAEVIAHDFEIEGTGSTDGSSNVLIVNRDFVNNGTFTANTGWVSFKPYATGTVGGTTVTEFNDMILEGDGNLLMDNDVDLRGTLRPNKGVFDTGGLNLRLISDGSGDAAIGEFKAGTNFIGDVNLERHVPAGDQIWFNIGNPITGVTFADWNDDITTTGFAGSDWPFWGFNNIRSYDETTNGDLDQGFVGASNITDAISSDNGYMIYVEAGAQNIEVTGGIQMGDMAQSLSYTSNVGMADDGWNLVVNRYPSEIDWDLLYANSTGVNSTYAVHDGDSFSGTRNYVIYDAATGVGPAGDKIATSQSFWVKVDVAGGQLNWAESVKSQSGAAFQRGLYVLPLVGLKLTGETSADYTYVVFDDEMTGGYDSGRDAFHLGGGENWAEIGDEDAPVGLSTIGTDDHQLSINNMSWEDAQTAIPIKISSMIAQTMTISSQNIMELPESVCMSIEDLETGEVYPFDEDFELTFELEEAFVGVRFMLFTSAPIQTESNDMSCSYNEDGSASATAVGDGPFTYTWYDEMGAEIFAETTSGTSTISNLALGNYVVVITGTDAFCSEVQHTFYIDQPSAIEFTSLHEGDQCQAGHGWIQIQEATNELFTLEVYDEDDNLVLSESETYGSTIVEDLVGGIYTVIINTACETFEYEFDLSDPMAVTAEIENGDLEVVLEGETVNVNVSSSVENATSIAWYLDGLLVGDLEDLQLTFDEAGTYELTLNATGDLCSASDVIVITVQTADNIVEADDLQLTIATLADGIQIDLSIIEGLSNLQIFNVAGQLVVDRQINVGGQHFVGTNDLSSGVYTVKLFSANASFVGQFVK